MFDVADGTGTFRVGGEGESFRRSSLNQGWSSNDPGLAVRFLSTMENESGDRGECAWPPTRDDQHLNFAPRLCAAGVVAARVPITGRLLQVAHGRGGL